MRLTIKYNDQVLQARLDSMSARMRTALSSTVTALTLSLWSRIKEAVSGSVLKVRTGNLRSHIMRDVQVGDHSVYGEVYSTGVKYARIHEFGGKTAPHTILPRHPGGTLAFTVNGKKVFARRVNHPGSTIPERSYMRSTLRSMRSTIVSQLRQTVSAVARARS